MLNLLLIFAESLSMLIWFHTGFGYSIFKSRGKVLFIIGYVTFFFVTSEYNTGMLVDLIPSVLMYFWCVNQFEGKPFLSLIRYIISLLAVGFVQLISLEMVYIFICSRLELKLWVIYLLANVICLAVAFAFYCLARAKKKKLSRYDYYTLLVLFYIVIMMVVIKYLYEKRNGIYSNLYIFLFVLLILFVVVVARGVKISYKLKEKQLELELKERYEEAYNKLILEMRRKQHDYKNQITALYSIQLAGDNNYELTTFQKNYANKLLEESVYEKLLIGCDNPVLSGYVYTCCCEADRIGIKIHPKILCTKREYNIGLHQVIEVLGILINNAMEYLNKKCDLDKIIKLDIHEEKERLHIYVSNVSEHKSYSTLEKMFQLGYSEKGKERGLGLYSLKKLVENNKGQLVVENIKEVDRNWLSIKVII